METKQLHAGGTVIYPKGNYEHDNAAERIQHLETGVEEIKGKTFTAAEVGADPEGSADAALMEAKNYADSTYVQATGYTDNKVADLIHGAPSTMDTLKEIADAMEENQTVVESLEAAIGSKASDIDYQAHKNNMTVHLTSTEHAELTDANSKKHTHGNKPIIESITQALIDAWNLAVAHISDTIKHITATERTNWNAAKTHADSAHAPSNAQKNSEVTKAEIESKLTGTISTHNHSIPTMTTTVNGIGKPDNITIGVSNGTFETKFKNYTSLADLGLTAPKTCLEIATAMENNSSIILMGEGNNQVSDTPERWGTVRITRRSPSYASAEFTASVAGGCHRYVRNLSTADPLYVSEWIEYLTTSKLTNNLLATVEGTALDAVQGKALDTRVTANTNDIDTLNSKLVYTIDNYDGTYITFVQNRVVRTGTGEHIFQCIVHIPNVVPDATELFSVDNSLNGMIFITQRGTGKTFPVAISYGLAKAWGNIEAGNSCILTGILI